MLQGYGWTPFFVEGDEPMPMHEAMAAALDTVLEMIRQIQADARKSPQDVQRPASADDRAGIAEGMDGSQDDRRQTHRGQLSDRIKFPITDPVKNPQHLNLLEDWLRSYRPAELFDANGRLNPELADLAPRGQRRMGANPNANGGLLLRDLRMPDFADYAVDVAETGHWRRRRHPRAG